jgi:hydrogenase expression/formation protein HypE
LVEISEQSNVTIEINEQALPIKPAVKAACEMLGFDPLYVANEGKLVAFVKESDAEKVLATMKQTKYGEDSVVIGKVIGTGKPQLRLKTAIGGTRLVDMLPGEMLPRIC